MIFIIDDDREMAECIKLACGSKKTKIFSDTISAISALDSEKLPDLIFLDILLDGPDGFTFLNELVSYSDTVKIPVVIVSSLNLKNRSLESYGVIGVLDKAEMTPKDIQEFINAV